MPTAQPLDESSTGFHERAVKIAADLREAIVGQAFEPGDRVPSRDELTRRYGVSKATVQRALQALTTEGFVESRGNQGTFVAHTSPHLTRYYLLLPTRTDTTHPNQAWVALAQAARAMDGNAEFICHVDRHDAAGRETYARMIEDVESNRVAGIIFAESPFEYDGTPLLTQPGIPRTAIAQKSLFAGIPVISHDFRSFFVHALGVLRDRGCRRPALLSTSGLLRQLDDGDLPRLLDQHGMRMPHHWHQTGDWGDVSWLPNLVRLLFDYPGGQHPDGLIIANDNFAEPATQALAELGLSSLPVIAQANFPYPTPARMPVVRVGFSTTHLLQLLMTNIDMQRRGETPPTRQLLPAVIENDPTAV